MDAFYKKIGKKIKNIRNELGLSQESVANLLKINRVALSQIENGERKISAEELAKMAKIFNTKSDILLDLEKDVKLIFSNTKEQKTEQDPEIRISVPQKNIEKFKEVLLYILKKVGSKPNVGESVLYKLLYFIDFDFYEKYEEQLIGATYIKNHYGPTPKEFIKVIEEMEGKDLAKVEEKYFQYPLRKYLPLRDPDMSKINVNGNEQEVIDDVLKKLSDMNATQISDYSHEDIPWKTAEEGKPLSYESVFYRDERYSVRKYDDEL